MHNSRWLMSLVIAAACSDESAPKQSIDAGSLVDAAQFGDAHSKDGQVELDDAGGALIPTDVGHDAAASLGDGGIFSPDECGACARTTAAPADSYCNADQPVLWTCDGSGKAQVTLHLQANCKLVPTGLARFCCADDFTRECPRD